MNDVKIRTYPKMNEHIKFSLGCSKDRFDEYVLVRLTELEEENKFLKEKLESWKERAFKAQMQTEDVLLRR